jgi:hypothetical protein
MPEVFRELGFVFFFYANESIEPMHIHVRKAGWFRKVLDRTCWTLIFTRNDNK